jgi:hypothetical protein
MSTFLLAAARGSCAPSLGENVEDAATAAPAKSNEIHANRLTCRIS